LQLSFKKANDEVLKKHLAAKTIEAKQEAYEMRN